jgi:hypothetical protein
MEIESLLNQQSTKEQQSKKVYSHLGGGRGKRWGYPGVSLNHINTNLIILPNVQSIFQPHSQW